MDEEIAQIVDKHLAHRNPADSACRGQLIAELKEYMQHYIDNVVDFYY